MDPLPMAPSCTLDETGLRLQLERYRQTGAGARLIDRTRRSLIESESAQIVGRGAQDGGVGTRWRREGLGDGGEQLAISLATARTRMRPAR